MPGLPRKPCAVPGCAHLTRSRYCERHTKEKREAWATTTTSSTARGYGARHQRRAARLLAREPLCRPCDEAGHSTLATTVDHIVPKSEGGTDADANLQPICAECHATKTAAEAARGRQRARLRRRAAAPPRPRLPRPGQRRPPGGPLGG